MKEVVAALIQEKGRFMIGQRAENKDRGMHWEFVGGKVEPGETEQAALVRECREELGITVSVGPLFMEFVHVYPDVTIHLSVYETEIAEGEPQKLEHKDIRWATISELEQYDFCGADRVVLNRLRQKLGEETQW